MCWTIGASRSCLDTVSLVFLFDCFDERATAKLTELAFQTELLSTDLSPRIGGGTPRSRSWFVWRDNAMIIHREKRRNPSKDDGDWEQQQLDWARQDGAVVVLLHRKTRIFLELTWPVGSDSCPGLRQSPDHSAVSKELTQAAISRHKSPIPPPSGLNINFTAAAMRQRKVCDLFATPLQKKKSTPHNFIVQLLCPDVLISLAKWTIILYFSSRSCYFFRTDCVKASMLQYATLSWGGAALRNDCIPPAGWAPSHPASLHSPRSAPRTAAMMRIVDSLR